MKKDIDIITPIDGNGFYTTNSTTTGTAATAATINEISKFRQALPQFLAVGVKNILLFVYGMTLGFPTIVIPAIQGGDGREPSDIILNRDQISWFSSINLICVPLGCIFSGAFTQPIGKRRAMQAVNIPIIISWLLFHFATSIEYLYAALFLSGLTGGLMEAPVLTYVAEITQPEYRGLLSASGSTFVIFGVFLQFILGSILDWRTIAAVSTIFPVISILALFFVPESPTWLIRKNRLNEAIKALQWLRGWVPSNHIEQEFNELYDQLILKPQNQKTKQDDNKCQKFMNNMALFKKRLFLCPFTLILFTFFVGHFSGKTALQTYAVQIFHTLKAPINKYHATILLGLCELIATILCVILIHFTGKRPLVFISTIGVGLCFFGTATYAYYLNIVPGFAINNVVVNASSLVSKDSIITTDNITKIFQAEQNTLLAVKLNFNTTKIYDDNDDATERETEQTTNHNFDINLNRTIRDLLYNNATYNNYNDYDIINETNSENSTEENLNYDDDLTETTTIFTISSTIIINNNTNHNVKSITKNIDGGSGKNQILLPVPKQKKNYLVWLPLLLLLGAAFFAHLGLRLIPWMLIGEVYPASVRSNATGISGGCGYILGFLANKFFLQMLATMTLPGTFWFYSAVAFFGTIILYFVLPETEGKTLMECEELFTKNTTNNTKNADSSMENNEIKSSNILPPLPIGILEIPINIQNTQSISLKTNNTNSFTNGTSAMINKGFIHDATEYDDGDENDDNSLTRTTHF